MFDNPPKIFSSKGKKNLFYVWNSLYRYLSLTYTKTRNMELQGALIEKLEPITVTTQSGDKLKRIFVVQQPGQYGKPVAFECMSPQLIDFITDTKIDSELLVKFDLSSRRWKKDDKPVQFFTTAFAFGAEVVKARESMEIPVTQVSSPLATSPSMPDDLPF